MRNPTIRRWARETALVAGLAACISVISFIFYFRHDAVLLYGDAVAHINIARRVFDSRTPGLLQLGTVWLPLPHLLMIPFLFTDWAWRTGAGGSVPSMIAYVLGTIGIFRLVRTALSFRSGPDTAGRIAAWLAAIVYAANPNLIYLQTTAMTEALYLALSIWAIVYFFEFAQQAILADPELQAPFSSSLMKCGLCLVGTCFTRYDGWFLTVVTLAAAVAVVLKTRYSGLKDLRKFAVLVAVAPALWLAYNAIIYRNPLEFANGPYSARAIEQKTARPGYPPHPGTHSLPVAGSYFLKSAELNVADGKWQRFWAVLLLIGTAMSLTFNHRLWPLLLLWVPLPFYMLSIAYSGVPIFLPEWWPFSYYNVRYGLELLPAFSVFVALAMHFMAGLVQNSTGKSLVRVAVFIFVAGSYWSVWRAQPVCYREAWINSRSRIALETELAARLKTLPANSTVLMYLGDHVGAVQQAGIPLRRVINEGNHRTWRQPADPQGLWEQALSNPPEHVDFAVATEGDPVSVSLQVRGLVRIAQIQVPGQPTTTIYETHSQPQ
jgi:hypothetical protein